jgi:hypothetical protein
MPCKGKPEFLLLASSLWILMRPNFSGKYLCMHFLHIFLQVYKKYISTTPGKTAKAIKCIATSTFTTTTITTTTTATSTTTTTTTTITTTNCNRNNRIDDDNNNNNKNDNITTTNLL